MRIIAEYLNGIIEQDAALPFFQNKNLLKFTLKEIPNKISVNLQNGEILVNDSLILPNSEGPYSLVYFKRNKSLIENERQHPTTIKPICSYFIGWKNHKTLKCIEILPVKIKKHSNLILRNEIHSDSWGIESQNSQIFVYFKNDLMAVVAERR